MSESDGGERVGVVLTGGGARGAYEVGALSVIMPALSPSGRRGSIFAGASVGAINALAMAGLRHLDPEESAERGLARWRQVTMPSVMRPILRRRLAVLAVRYAARVLSVPRVRVAGLLDPAPLAGTLRGWIDWEAVHRNVRSGLVDAVAAVATAARSGASVAFVESAGGRGMPRSRGIVYAAARLGVEHLMASSAMPMLFPPVLLSRPTEARGWYLDGSTRLHTPIKPALDLGAERVVVVGTTPLTGDAAEPSPDELAPPDLADGAVNILNGLLEDALTADIRTLGNINRFYAGELAGTAGSRRFRESRGKPAYRKVPYIFVAPSRPGSIARVASEVFRSNYGGWRGLRSPDFPFLERVLGGRSPLQGELLSYILFDRDFIDELIEMGRRDARRWLVGQSGPDAPWRTGPLDRPMTRAPARWTGPEVGGEPRWTAPGWRGSAP